MGYQLCGFPIKLIREFEDELLMIIDPDYFPRGIKVMRLLQMHAPELHDALAASGWEVWAMPTEAAYK